MASPAGAVCWRKQFRSLDGSERAKLWLSRLGEGSTRELVSLNVELRR